ncbi:MAG: hypothetical protein NUV67_02945 [archaeon]|nr:hypothetical protein [archaeon]
MAYSKSPAPKVSDFNAGAFAQSLVGYKLGWYSKHWRFAIASAILMIALVLASGFAFGIGIFAVLFGVFFLQQVRSKTLLVTDLPIYKFSQDAGVTQGTIRLLYFVAFVTILTGLVLLSFVANLI